MKGPYCEVGTEKQEEHYPGKKYALCNREALRKIRQQGKPDLLVCFTHAAHMQAGGRFIGPEQVTDLDYESISLSYEEARGLLKILCGEGGEKSYTKRIEEARRLLRLRVGGRWK